MESEFEDYVEETKEDIRNTLDEYPYQPILFVGSGTSMRYFDGPSWKGLLSHLADQCPKIDKSLAYYTQNNDLQEVGGIFADKYREWAWDEGRSEFPDDLFSPDNDGDIYIKHKTAEYFDEITPAPDDAVDEDSRLQTELDNLQKIQPHTIITTNYDQFIDDLFPEYEPIIGQEILQSEHQNIGEVFKIHGCTSEPSQLVFTDDDYDEFDEKKQYLSAKLLTFFAEHPLLIVGYSASDPNVIRILSDMEKMLTNGNDLIPNVYFIEWKEDIDSQSELQSEKVIPLQDGRSVRVNCITANHFDWIFDTFGEGGELEGVKVKMLRKIAAHTYDVIRTDVPSKTVELNYDILENSADSKGEVAKLFGITATDNPSAFGIIYPYRASDVAEELGFDHWYYVNELIDEVNDKEDVNIRNSDNKYHQDVGGKGRDPEPRYSMAAIELLKKVRDDEMYEVEIPTEE